MYHVLTWKWMDVCERQRSMYLNYALPNWIFWNANKRDYAHKEIVFEKAETEWNRYSILVKYKKQNRQNDDWLMTNWNDLLYRHICEECVICSFCENKAIKLTKK